ncbi:MAG: diguanylate cyclase [Pseudomonadota bacterium]
MVPSIDIRRASARRAELHAAKQPKSATALIALVACLGALVPCISAAFVLIFAEGGFWAAMPGIAVIGLASIVSSIGVVYALRSLLAPVFALERVLEFYREHGVHEAWPQNTGDRTGKLVYLVDGLMSKFRAELRQSRTAADTDPLTGLLNRRGFDRHFDAPNGGSIIYVDLDQFKAVNDKLGHDAGDLVLSATADLLRSVLREGELVARFGGEEFVVFLPEIDLMTAGLVAERIRSSAERRLATKLGRVTISAGVAQLAAGEDFSEALIRADRAVYTAKRSGRNCVEFEVSNATALNPTVANATAAE